MNSVKNILLILLFSVFSWSQDITDGCDLPDSETTGYLHLTSDGSVLYKSVYDIGGFQFDVDGATVLSASGGEAEAQGFIMSNSPTTVLGFSLEGTTINGCGTLVDLSLSGEPTGLSNLIISDAVGSQIYFEYYEEVSITGCTDESACNYNPDATEDDGNCEYAEENYDCDGNCIFEIDCFGECGGSAVTDDCGVCGGNNDCFGCIDESACNYNPDATEDDSSCEYAMENYDCDGNCIVDIDCAGVCGGDALEEECLNDCFGIFQGTAEWDDCGVCIDCSVENEGEISPLADCTQHLAWNVSCTDCNDDLNGDAFKDGCGDCVWGNTGESACLFDCDLNLAGDWGPYITDECNVCDNNEWNNCEVDCFGVWGGTAYIDNCGHCVGGTTERIACWPDCTGEWGGTAEIDDCGICNGYNEANLGPDANDIMCGCFMPGPSGCDNTCGSTLELDECDVCGGDNSSCADCAGVPYGDAELDDCDICNGGNSSCADCAGVPNGDNLEDNCGVCDNDPYNDCVPDCDGEWGGDAEMDNCDTCDNLPSNDCLQDCVGIWGGDLIGHGEFECVGEGDENNSPSDFTQVECDGAEFLWLQIGNDLCGVCGGDNSTCLDECSIPNGGNTSCSDCEGVPYGDAELEYVDEDWINYWITQDTASYSHLNYNFNSDEQYCCPSGEFDSCGVCDGPGEIWECDCIGLPTDEILLSATFGNLACGCNTSVFQDDCGTCDGQNNFIVVDSLGVWTDIDQDGINDYCDIEEGLGSELFKDEYDNRCVSTDDNGDPTDFCDCAGTIIVSECGLCLSADSSEDSSGDQECCDFDKDCAGVCFGNANFDECSNCYDGTLGVCLVDGIDIDDPDLENNQAACSSYGECRIDGNVESTWDFVELDTTGTALNTQQLCEDHYENGDNIVGACKIGDNVELTWDFEGLDTTDTVLDEVLCEKQDDDNHQIVGRCTVSEWDFVELDTTGTVLNTFDLCKSPGTGIGNCIGDNTIKDENECECSYNEWEPSQWIEAEWYSSAWFNAVWDPTTQPTVDEDNYICAAIPCIETYEECCVNNWGIWDTDSETCEMSTGEDELVKRDFITGESIGRWNPDTNECFENTDESNFLIDDCAGECGGNSVEDNCDYCICGTDLYGEVIDPTENSECISNEDPLNNCVEDCNGEWGSAGYANTCFYIEITAEDTTYNIESNFTDSLCVAADTTSADFPTYPYKSFVFWSEDGSDECGLCGGNNFKGPSNTFESGDEKLIGQCNNNGSYYCQNLDCDCNDVCLPETYLDCAGECYALGEGALQYEEIIDGEAVESCCISGELDCNDECDGDLLNICYGYELATDKTLCAINGGYWSVNGNDGCGECGGSNIFISGEPDVLASISFCEDLIDNITTADSTQSDCEADGGSWHFEYSEEYNGIQQAFLDIDGDCGCDAGDGEVWQLDCDGKCGGTNLTLEGCTIDLNDNWCTADKKDECGYCYGEGMAADACDCFGNKENCAGECPYTDDDEDGVWILNTLWVPISDVDYDEDNICDDVDDCISNPLNNKHLFYQCDIDVTNEDYYENGNNIIGGICPQENLSEALDPEGIQNTNYGGFDPCGICNGDGFSCGFEVEGGVKEIKLSWDKPYNNEFVAVDTSQSRVKGNTTVSIDSNSLYYNSGGNTVDGFITLKIENIDTNEGTLDIYMTNVPGCAYCTDDQYHQKGQCEILGNTTQGADWIQDPAMSESDCADIEGKWFDGHISGFQFEIVDPMAYVTTKSTEDGEGYYTILDASGGTAEEAGFTMTFNDKIFGFSTSGGTISSSINEILTTITFTNTTTEVWSTDYNNTGICFGEDKGTAYKNLITDGSGDYVDTTIWGDCYCDEENAPADVCGVCDGEGIAEGTCDCAGNVNVGCGCGNPGPSTSICWDEETPVCFEYECPPNPDALNFNIYYEDAVGDLFLEKGGWKYNHYTQTGLDWVEAVTYAVSYSYQGQEYFLTEIEDFTDNQDPENAVRILGVTDSLILGCIFPSSCSYDEENPANEQLDSLCWWSEYGCDCESPQYSEADECGVCEGPGPENNYDCDGNCTAVDECGICGGDGTSCLSLYNGIIPEVFSIHNIYPNPFNPHANIVYGVPEVSQVKVSVYDIQGRKVVMLQNDVKSPGYYEIQWDASEFSSGVYFIEMLSGDFRQIKRVLHMK